jgi:hypothetical protein
MPSLVWTACKPSNHCAGSQCSSLLHGGSWQVFWLDENFSRMMFGQVMANIRHMGEEVVRLCFGHFFEVVLPLVASNRDVRANLSLESFIY